MMQLLVIYHFCSIWQIFSGVTPGSIMVNFSELLQPILKVGNPFCHPTNSFKTLKSELMYVNNDSTLLFCTVYCHSA